MRICAVLRAVEVARSRTPLIKFRRSQQLVEEHVASSKSSQSEMRPKMGRSVQQIVIEDYQLPLRFRRLAFDEREIDAINTGGAV